MLGKLFGVVKIIYLLIIFFLLCCMCVGSFPTEYVPEIVLSHLKVYYVSV